MIKSKKVIKNMMNYYMRNMNRIAKTYDDDTILDVEDWYAAKVLFNEYKETGTIIEPQLLDYFKNQERTNLVLSYFRIMKHQSDYSA